MRLNATRPICSIPCYFKTTLDLFCCDLLILTLCTCDFKSLALSHAVSTLQENKQHGPLQSALAYDFI